MKHIFILCLSMIMYSCTLFSQTNDNSTIEDYKKEIIGSWGLENDSKTKIIFSSHGKIKFYSNNKLERTMNYKITRTCDGETIPDSKGYFLKITNKNGIEFCDYIEGLNYENNGLMSLMMKNRGIIVVYKKQ